MNCLFAWVKKKSFFYVLSYLQLAVSFGSFKKTERLYLCLQKPRSTKRKQSDNPGRKLSNDGRVWFETNCDVALVGKEKTKILYQTMESRKANNGSDLLLDSDKHLIRTDDINGHQHTVAFLSRKPQL